MEKFNQALFLLLNAPPMPAPLPLAIAMFFGEYAIWLIPATFVAAWLRGGEDLRKSLLQASTASLVGLSMNQLIGLCWQHPRPFMIGLGHGLLPHVADSSFPSDHLTVIWAIAFSLLAQRRSRGAAITLAALGLPVAWARIYIGVHFPLDMIGALAVAGLAGWLGQRHTALLIKRAYPALLGAYRRLFAPLIRRGWVRA